MLDVAVVTAAGASTRLLPATKNQPREMLPLGRTPMVQRVVEELAQSGIDKIVLVTGPNRWAVEGYFDQNAELIAFLRECGREELLDELDFRGQLQFFYARQRRPLGLGHAIGCARGVIGQQPFAVAPGNVILGLRKGSDSGVVPTFRRMIEEFERSRADAVIAFEETPRSELARHAVVRPNRAAASIFDVVELVHKPAAEEAPSNLAVAGRFVFAPRIFEFLERTPPPPVNSLHSEENAQLIHAIRALIQHGGRVQGVRLPPEERRFEVTDGNSYYRAFCEFALADPHCGPALAEFLGRLPASSEPPGGPASTS